MTTVNIEDRTPLNVVKYTTKDFPSFFDSLLRRLKTEYADVYNDYVSTTVGIMLVDLMAYGLSQLAWYMDRRASDVYLDTARTRQAVERIVKQIGYKMQPAAASSTDLTLIFTDGIPANGPLEAGFRFSGPDSLVFESVADLILSYSATPVTYELNVRQGVTKNLTYTSDGLANQSYRFSSVQDGKYLAEGSVKCWVDGSRWDEVDFLEFEKTNQFEIAYNESPPLIQFGNGIAGNKPDEHAEIKLEFVIIDGKSGNVKANTIQTAIDVLKISGNEVAFTVNNAVGSAGGTEPETADKARTFAPFSFAARGATITQPDYYTLTSTFTDPQYGSVAKAYAYVPRGVGQDQAFDALMDVIVGLVAAHATSMAAQDVIIEGLVDDLDTDLDSVDTAVSNIETIRTATLVPQVGVADNAGLALKQEGTNVIGDMTTASNILASMDVQIAQITAPAGVKTALESLSTQMASIISSTSAEGSSIVATADVVNGATKLLTDSISGTGASANTIESNVDDLEALSTSMRADAASIETAFGVVDGAATTLKTAVDAAVLAVETYIGELFDHDCKSNVVQVPILAQLDDGTYVAPSTGLIQALQTYLDNSKEVTQTVQVIDGSHNLAPVYVDIDVKVLSDFVPAEVKSQISSIVTELLTGRDFNEPLYLHILDTMIGENVEGIDYINIVMTADEASYIDASGNCVPPAQKIITKGSVTVLEI